MNQQRKEFLRREMLACAREAHLSRKYHRSDTARAQMWLDLASKRLYQLGGMCGNW
ncbi:hypothetical protein [Burkholderia cepacia]|uniref:hypothetical protein n=1 Tax=Burkholderia cepacia TaxID=292 RepID=UPI000AF4CEEA|nr:hypothetical protein [Burkholderia cepacia]